MATFALCFSETSPADAVATPELHETSYSAIEYQPPYRAVRGKTSGAYRGYGTFQWTPGVQGLCILMLLEKSANGSSVPQSIQGYRGSYAASLDHALSKPPQWLIDIFGWDGNGEPNCKRLFLRSNPGCKQPGAVTVSLNQRQLTSADIRVFVGEREVIDTADLLALVQRLEATVHSGKQPVSPATANVQSTNKPSVVAESLAEIRRRYISDQSLKGQFPTPFDFAPLHDSLRAMFRQEIHTTLHATDIFLPRRFTSALNAISTNPSFTRLVGRRRDCFASMDTDLPSGHRLGEASEYELRSCLQRDEPVHISLPAVQPATIAILLYLKYVKGYNLSLNFRFAYAVELVDKLIRADFDRMPDICVCGIGPAARLLAHPASKYAPYLLVPMLTHRVVAPASSTVAVPGAGEYHFVTDEPTTASFYFDSLERGGVLSRKRLGVRHMEPDEVLPFFQEGGADSRSILWFPHYRLLEVLGIGRTIDDSTADNRQQPSIMFAHTEFARDKKRARLLNVAIRNAWLEMKSGSAAIDIATDLVVHNREYLNWLVRIAGLHAIPPQNLQGMIAANETLRHYHDVRTFP